MLASTFPASADDPVPAFVRDQVVALALQHPELDFDVLAPHDQRSQTASLSIKPHYSEHRFHYFWPRRAERLTGRGIMPALRKNPFLYGVIPFLFFGEFIATLRLVRRIRPTMIYAHWFTPQAIVASWVSRLTGVPFVFTTHASDVDVWRRIPLFGPRIVRGVSAQARAITAVSSRSRSKLTSFLAADDAQATVDVIPMGVDIPAVSPDHTVRTQIRTRLGLDGKVVYLFIGRLVEKKGIHFLLEALKLADTALTDWTLVVAGDGPLRSEVQAAVAALGLSDRVMFPGYVTGETKDEYLRSADVLVVPSIIATDGDAEGLPVALLEGLAYGLLCVATDESGADDILTDGVDGYLCPQKDAVALAAKLRTVDALGPDARAEVSARASRLAHNYSWDVIVERHYDTLIAPLLSGGTRA
ncbi:hypothetical protein ASC66_09435 [Leifsonia sp. Root4]|uniref:glycosyltransferase n=1 Tax=Leifsonia sp. Root4 TaxID=1736525 RepID=UPI0006F2C8AA|nr:glycosyltransferase [Leifsonia sp. Root4]KQW06666.1 hypothetical protein ASC66_09435 [Leifsonia sp. Root4]